MNLSRFLGTDRIAKSNIELGRDIISANTQLSRTLKDISELEIRSKDRVNITLAEYERMKEEISDLSYENRKLRSIFEQIEFPFNEEIVPGSVNVFWADDIDFCNFTNRRRCHIQFDVELKL